MNKNQKNVAIAAVSIMFVMLIFPPFQAIREHGTFNLGYGFIFMPPSGLGTVNVGLLFMQWLIVIFGGTIALYLLKGKH